MSNQLKCIVCNFQPNPALDEDVNQPYNATSFITEGHYGSTFFDPMNGTWLEINVCDECLTKAAAEDKILRYKSRKEFELHKGRGS